MDTRNIFESIMPLLNSSDPNSVMKMQDIIDIVYKLNRIQNNSYDQSYVRRLNNMSPADKAQSMIRNMSGSMDSQTQRSAENFIGILRNLNEVKSNMEGMNIRKYNTPTGLNSKKSMGGDYSALDKLKNFLISLNDQ